MTELQTAGERTVAFFLYALLLVSALLLLVSVLSYLGRSSFFSKISVGIATGGVDYMAKETSPRQNFGGGGGTGLTVVPVGFLVIDKHGDVEFIIVSHKGKPDPVDQIADFVERTPNIIAKIKDLFSKDEKPEETV